MDFKSHIPKPKPNIQLLRNLFLIAISLFTALPLLLASSITTYADESYLSSEELSQIAGTIYNGTSSSNRGGNSAIPNGVLSTRTGYLCYMLTKDGGTTGLPAYAFASPGYNGIAGSRWVCTSRRGQSVSSWYRDAPWNVTPWDGNTQASHEPQIRDWMLQPINGKPQAQQFVFETWGVAAEKNFSSDEYILVIETIMNFQYSISDGSGGSNVVYISKSAIEAQALARVDRIITNISTNLSESQKREIKRSILSSIVRSIENELKKYPDVRIGDAPSGSGSGRTFTSDPLIGTVPNLIQYKGQSTVFNSYTNKVAPHAEKIKVSEAGFTAYTGSGSTQLSDSEVQSYGVAMLIIHCKNDAIHTYNGYE